MSYCFIRMTSILSCLGTYPTSTHSPQALSTSCEHHAQFVVPGLLKEDDQYCCLSYIPQTAESESPSGGIENFGSITHTLS